MHSKDINLKVSTVCNRWSKTDSAEFDPLAQSCSLQVHVVLWHLPRELSQDALREREQTQHRHTKGLLERE